MKIEKVESVFQNMALKLLKDLELDTKMIHSKFDSLRESIAKSSKAFYLLGMRGYDVGQCKDLIAEFDDTLSIDELLEKAADEGEEE